MSFDNIAAVIELCVIAFVPWVQVCCSAVAAFTWEQLQKSGPKSFHFLWKPHVMSYIRWIKDVCAPKIWPEISPPPHSFSFTSPSSLLFIFLLSRLHVFCFVFSLLSLLSLALPRSVLHSSASASSAHSLGSTGSETVTQSSLVIGHGHANQTGRNLQLIRILPPAIIPPPPPHPQPPHSPQQN